MININPLVTQTEDTVKYILENARVSIEEFINNVVERVEKEKKPFGEIFGEEVKLHIEPFSDKSQVGISKIGVIKPQRKPNGSKMAITYADPNENHDRGMKSDSKSFTLIDSSKGSKPTLILDGRSYRMVNSMASEKKGIWRCLNYRLKNKAAVGCQSKLITECGRVSKVTAHSARCLPDAHKFLLRHFLDKMSKVIGKSGARKSYERESQSLIKIGLDHQSGLPTFEQLQTDKVVKMKRKRKCDESIDEERWKCNDSNNDGMDSTRVTFSITNKGRQMASLDGYNYHCHVKHKDSRISWRCVKHYKLAKVGGHICRGELVTCDKGFVKQRTPHTSQCKPDANYVATQRFMMQLKRRARDDTAITVRDVYNQEVAVMKDDGGRFDGPTFEHVKSSLFRIRRKALGYPPVRRKTRKPVVLSTDATLVDKVIRNTDEIGYHRIDNAQISILTTQKGRPMASFDGYSYYVHVEHKDGKIIWRCINYAKLPRDSNGQARNCAGEIVTQDGTVLHFSQHADQCIPDSHQHRIRAFTVAVKLRARTEQGIPLRQIFEEECTYARAICNTVKLPTFKSMKSTLCRLRREAFGPQKRVIAGGDRNKKSKPECVNRDLRNDYEYDNQFIAMAEEERNETVEEARVFVNSLPNSVGGSYKVRSTWQGAVGFQIDVLYCDRAFSGKMDATVIDATSRMAHMTALDYIKECESALTNQQQNADSVDGFTYNFSLNSDERGTYFFVVGKTAVSSGIKMHFCEIPLWPINYAELSDQIIAATLQTISELRCSNEMLQQENIDLKEGNKKLESALAELTVAKIENENTLYARFLRLLNSKKAKIKELTEGKSDLPKNIYDTLTDDEEDDDPPNKNDINDGKQSSSSQPSFLTNQPPSTEKKSKPNWENSFSKSGENNARVKELMRNSGHFTSQIPDSRMHLQTQARANHFTSQIPHHFSEPQTQLRAPESQSKIRMPESQVCRRVPESQSQHSVSESQSNIRLPELQTHHPEPESQLRRCVIESQVHHRHPELKPHNRIPVSQSHHHPVELHAHHHAVESLSHHHPAESQAHHHPVESQMHHRNGITSQMTTTPHHSFSLHQQPLSSSYSGGDNNHFQHNWQMGRNEISGTGSTWRHNSGSGDIFSDLMSQCDVGMQPPLPTQAQSQPISMRAQTNIAQPSHEDMSFLDITVPYVKR